VLIAFLSRLKVQPGPGCGVFTPPGSYDSQALLDPANQSGFSVSRRYQP